MASTPSSTTTSWLSIVVAADLTFYQERRSPEVYLFSGNNHKRDVGDQGGPYANHAP